ncbi:GNAT family N-acetyltransferase [Mucilaginibacter sp. BJC16-A38]|uniref:GNAT family N-acetyltransferase n=1 Tax=Mucilaginibacter phenanthrenivorans TaxID=1234842 RepID=UPI002157693E|nr:GNAT family N-acetyltransferase [Mucilaginibacter phenanthrenivorans]MCR8560979.1 GNAT family N-acetyltransferase [Mucilaginibacter phenanthrenivorans]
MSSITLKRTDSDDPHFLNLVIALDKDLDARYGEQQAFFNQFNKLTHIKNVVVAYAGGVPVGCAGFKEYEAGTVEIKRMFVDDNLRGKGIAGKILTELETWATELGYQTSILETANKQHEAIRLYQKCGYEITENYGDYIGVEISICMRKGIK